ncbi:hypothetical protein [Micavibrio aeruginosavorus]|uniref:hypothetical protein n=1 Tax=Micavibrio aeruginosavorus TaxID=349221 RepID=UPI003F4ACDC7
MAALEGIAEHLPDVAGGNIIIITQDDIKTAPENMTMQDGLNSAQMYARGIQALMTDEGLKLADSAGDFPETEYFDALGGAMDHDGNYGAVSFPFEKDGEKYHILLAPQLPVPLDVYYNLSESGSILSGPAEMDQKSATAMVLSHEAGHIYSYNQGRLSNITLEGEVQADQQGFYGYDLMRDRGLDIHPDGVAITQALRDIAVINTLQDDFRHAAKPALELHDHDTGLLAAGDHTSTASFHDHAEAIDNFFRQTNAMIGASYQGTYAAILSDPSMRSDERKDLKDDKALMVATYHPYDPDIETALALRHAEQNHPAADSPRSFSHADNVHLGSEIGGNYPETQYAFARAMRESGLYDHDPLQKAYADRYLAAFEKLNPEQATEGAAMAAQLGQAMKDHQATLNAEAPAPIEQANNRPHATPITAPSSPGGL